MSKQPHGSERVDQKRPRAVRYALLCLNHFGLGVWPNFWMMLYFLEVCAFQYDYFSIDRVLV